MFKLAQSETFRWPVAWEEPGDGKMVQVSFTAVFHRLTHSEITEIINGERGDDPQITTARRLLAGWGDDVLDADGDPLPFSTANVHQLLEVAGAPGAIIKAFFEAVSGKGARKN